MPKSPWLSSTSDTVPGWSQPVYKGMQEGAQLFGVPFLFGAILALIALGCLLWYWPLLIVCAVLYGLARLGTALEPRWLDIMKRHLRYARHYEG